MGEDDYSWLIDALGGGGNGAPFQNTVDPTPITPTNDELGITPGLLEPLPLPGGDLVNGGNNPISLPTSNSGLTSTAFGRLLSALGVSGGTGNLLATLLPLLGTIGAGIYGRNNINRATDQTVQGLHDASAQASAMLGPYASVTGVRAPYLAAGQQGIQRLENMNSNLASRYAPLGSGRGMVSLGNLVNGH